MPKDDDYGLFKPFTKRMSKDLKKQIIDRFMDSGAHRSTTGFTARLLVAHCIENKLRFSVEYITDPAPSYVVRLTRR